MKPRSSARPLDVMLLGTLLAFGLVACGQQQEPAPAPPPAETAPPAAPAATEAPSLQERAMEAAESLSETFRLACGQGNGLAVIAGRGSDQPTRALLGLERSHRVAGTA